MGTIEPHFPFGIGVLSPGPLLFSCVPREGLVAVGTNFVGFECGWKRFVFPRRGGGCRKRIREKKRRLDDTSNGVKLMKYTHPTFLLLGDFNTGTV